MLNARSLSVRELKVLLINYFVEDRNKNTAIKKIFDIETKSSIINGHEIEKKIDNYFAGVMARSIKNGDDKVNPLSPRRVRYMIDILINNILILEEDAYKELDKKEKKFLKIMSRDLLTNMLAIFNEDENLYNNCLFFIDTVLILAQEKNVRPEDVFKTENISDKIIREKMTEEEFIISFNVDIEKHYNYETIKNIFLDNILLVYKNNFREQTGENISEEDFKKELMAYMEEYIKPKIEELLYNTQPKLKEYIKNEVRRIYHKEK